MDPRDPLDLLGAGQGMAVRLVAGAVPIPPYAVDVLLRNDAGDRTQPLGQPWALPHPPCLIPGEGRAKQKHFALPPCEEAPTTLAPLHVPVPDGRQNQKPESQMLSRHAQAPDFIVRHGRQGSKQKGQMLPALGCGFRPPDTRALVADVRPGC